MLLDIFLYNFSNLFVLLVGLNFAYVFIVRPQNIEKGSGNNHFFFDVLDKLSWNAIDKITSEKKKGIGKAEERCTRIEYFISTEKLKKETANSFSAAKELLINEYINGGGVDLDRLERAYKDEIEKKAATSHLPFICGLIGLYGILILIFAAVNEIQPTSFLFWSNILIVVILAICLIAEGEIWFKKEKMPKLHKLCSFFNFCFHPHFWKVLIVFPLMFGYFVTSLNGYEINSPNWVTDKNITYVTIIVCVLGFVGYFIWSNIYLWYVTRKYRSEDFFQGLNRAIKSVDDVINNHKEELDKIKKDVEQEKINKKDFGL